MAADPHTPAAEQDWPLGPTQQSYAQRLRGHLEKPANVTLALELGPAVPPDRVARDLARLAAAEPLLRATLTGGDPDNLRIRNTPGIDLEIGPESDRAARDECLYRQSQHVFSAGEPLWRAQFLPAPDGANVLGLAFHHIIFDGVSRGVLLRMLAGQESAAQESAAGPRPPLYREFADWQRKTFGPGERHTDFWRGHLDGWAHNRHVPLRFARDLDRPLDDGCAQRTASLTGLPLWQALRWGRRHGASLFTQVLAALSVVLGEATGEPENLVRATFHGRPPGFEDTLGCFGHDVVLRLRTEPVPLARALASTAAAWDGLGEHRFTPYRVVRAAAGASTLPFRPVIVTLNSFSTPARARAFGADAAVLEVPERLPEEGLHLQLARAADRLTLECTYHPVRFDAADVQAFLDRILAVLREPAES